MISGPSPPNALGARNFGLEITKHHQGFTHVHPPGLPLARLLPQTEQGPLGFYPGLRTPTDKTRRRTPGWGSILNTDPELRTRHDRPPICEFTRYARPRVERENFPYWYRVRRAAAAFPRGRAAWHDRTLQSCQRTVGLRRTRHQRVFVVDDRNRALRSAHQGRTDGAE